MDYYESEQQKDILKIRELLKELPPFVAAFFRGISDITGTKTRLAYAYDLKIFFSYLLKEHDLFKGKTMKTVRVSDLEIINVADIEMFMEYVTLYEKEAENNTHILQNKEKGKARKVAAIRSMYKYFYKREEIEKNPALLIELPKIHDKHITRLEINEMVEFLDEVENGENLNERQKRFHHYTKSRDLALITMLLGTGMRVSECVGLNITDIDFDNNGAKITRKGGNEVVIYFGIEVMEALQDYLLERNTITPKDGHENALFLSMQNKRINVRSVQNLVKKYSENVIKLKKISPHKLRSTYGTNLYKETGDIYLVADVLGHKDVNTTKRHYAQIDDERRRLAAKCVKLRKE